jgi:hypothetical protein
VPLLARIEDHDMTRAQENRAYFIWHHSAETMGSLLSALEAQPGHESMSWERRGAFNRAWLAGARHERCRVIAAA